MSSPDSPRLPARYYRVLITLLGEAMAAAEWQAALGDEAAALGAAQGELSLPAVERLCSLALRCSGDRLLGLRLGLAIGTQGHALLGQALLQAPDLDAAVRLAARYFALLHPGFSLSYHGDPEQVKLQVITRLNFTPAVLQLHLDAVLAATLGELRGLSPLALPPLHAELHWTPRDRRRYRALPGVHCHFARASAPGFALYLPRALLLARRPSGQDEQFERASRQCASAVAALTQQGRLVDWITLLLREAQGVLPSVGEIAHLLALSERSLRRRIRAEGSSFRQLQALQRLQRACSGLASGQRVGALAAELGYRDAANFTRAFRRSLGESPRSYKRRHCDARLLGHDAAADSQ